MVFTLSDALIVIYIIVGIALVAVLVRAFQILTDLKTSTAIIAKRTKEIDSLVDRIEKVFHDGTETLKGFMSSMDFIRTIKNKFNKESDGE